MPTIEEILQQVRDKAAEIELDRLAMGLDIDECQAILLCPRSSQGVGEE